MAYTSDAPFYESLDGALWVQWAPNVGTLYVWRGGLMVNLFNEDGLNFDVFTLGHADGSEATLEEVQGSIARRIVETEAADRG